MGSAYMTLEFSKVNVIRTPVGATKLLAQLCHIVGFKELDTAILPSLVDQAFDLYESARTLEEVETFLYTEIWKFGYHSFDRTIVDFIVCLAKARKARRRLVMVVATRYEFTETRLLDRCVVFDFSGSPRVRGLSVVDLTHDPKVVSVSEDELNRLFNGSVSDLTGEV